MNVINYIFQSFLLAHLEDPVLQGEDKSLTSNSLLWNLLTCSEPTGIACTRIKLNVSVFGRPSTPVGSSITGPWKQRKQLLSRMELTSAGSTWTPFSQNWNRTTLFSEMPIPNLYNKLSSGSTWPSNTSFGVSYRVRTSRAIRSSSVENFIASPLLCHNSSL